MELNYNNSESNTQLKALASRVLIEIGYILSIDINHKAEVQLYKTNEVLTGVDVIYPVGLGVGTPLTDCLVFIPRTCYHPDTGVDINQIPFSLAGAKALPISMGIQDRISLFNTHCNELNISSDIFSLLFGEIGLSFRGSNLNFNITKDGSIVFSLNDGLIRCFTSETFSRITYFNSDSIPYYQKEYDDGVIIEYFAGLVKATVEQKENMSLYEDWTRKVQYNLDGTITETINDEVSILSTYVNNKISLTIKGEDNSINLTTENCSLSIDTDGNISITTNGSTSISTSGDTSISTSGDTTLSTKGNTSISTSGDTTISSANVTVKADSTVTLQTGNGTLGAFIKELCQDISSLTTVGSPAAHTVNPTSQTVFTQLNTVWSQYFK